MTIQLCVYEHMMFGWNISETVRDRDLRYDTIGEFNLDSKAEY